MKTGWLDGEAQPIAGQVKMRTTHWDQAALENRNAFEFGLREVGLPESDVRDALAVRDTVVRVRTHLDRQIEDYWATATVRYEIAPPEVQELQSARGSAMDRLRDWFTGKTVRVEDTATTDVRISLFVLSAPSVPGCTATFAREQTAEGQLSWDVTIFGTGLSGSSSLEVSTSATFTAASGEAKVVFLPGSLTVEKVTVLQHGQEIGRGYRINAAEFKHNQPGLRLLPASTVLPAGELVSTYPLADDPTGALAKYTYSDKITSTMQLQLGIKVFGADLTLKAQATRSTSVAVTYGLKGGFDYELRQFAEGDGLVWRGITPHTSGPGAPTPPVRARRKK